MHAARASAPLGGVRLGEKLAAAHRSGTFDQWVDEFPRSVGSHIEATTRGMLRTSGQGAGFFAERLDAQSRTGHYFADIRRELLAAKLDRAYDEELIRDFAENYARHAKRGHSAEHRSGFARWAGVEPPSGPTMTPDGIVARLECSRWWRRALRRTWTRSAENGKRDLGMIRKGKEPYVSDEATNHHESRRRRTREWMESRVLTNEEGEQLELLKVHDRSIANPALRRGEFMCRVRGFEEYADDCKHVAEFWTLTAPSAFHAQHLHGARNAKFLRHSVRAGQAWLCKMWARCRAKFKRLSLVVYGVRVAEPHHDGTPHWHLVLFMPTHAVATVRTIIGQAWCSEFVDELTSSAAIEARQQVKSIDREKGSAVGYVAKYVSKNIDSAGSIADDNSDETGRPVSESVQRVVAWAATHGIRQFQQVGGPLVGVWREARRQRDPVVDADIERVRRAADSGNFAGYICAMSYDGIRAGRKGMVSLAKVETGEKSFYGEPRPARVIGLRCCSSLVITRLHKWRNERKVHGQQSDTGKHVTAAANVARTAEPNPRSRDRLRGLSDFSRAARASSSYLGPVAIIVREACHCPECTSGNFAPYRVEKVRNHREQSTAPPH